LAADDGENSISANVVASGTVLSLSCADGVSSSVLPA
jgi:hypothetical protein